MTREVHLIYFRPTGKFLSRAKTTSSREELVQIWEEVHEMRRLGRLPGLRPNAGRDLFVIVDVPDHPRRELRLVMPPLIDEDDVTPPRISPETLGPFESLEQIGPVETLARTSTRDVIDPEADTVVVDDGDAAIPKPIDET